MSTHFSVVAARSAEALRHMTEKIANLEHENESLRKQLVQIERNAQIADIANSMEEKGLNADMTFEEKVAHIRSARDIENVREAVQMASSGYIKIADVSDAPGRGSADTLTAFCLGAD